VEGRDEGGGMGCSPCEDGRLLLELEEGMNGGEASGGGGGEGRTVVPNSKGGGVAWWVKG